MSYQSGFTASLLSYDEVNEVFEILVMLDEVGELINSPIGLPDTFDFFQYGYRQILEPVLLKQLQVQIMGTEAGITSILPAGVTLPGGQILGFDAEFQEMELLDDGFCPHWFVQYDRKFFSFRWRLKFVGLNYARSIENPVPGDLGFPPTYGGVQGEKYWHYDLAPKHPVGSVKFQVLAHQSPMVGFEFFKFYATLSPYIPLNQKEFFVFNGEWFSSPLEYNADFLYLITQENPYEVVRSIIEGFSPIEVTLENPSEEYPFTSTPPAYWSEGREVRTCWPSETRNPGMSSSSWDLS